MLKLLTVIVCVQLSRATVQNAVTGKLETAPYRVSKRLVMSLCQQLQNSFHARWTAVIVLLFL